MNYYNQDNKKSKIIGILSVFIYGCLFVALYVWVGFDVLVEKEQGGIVIDFGTSDEGLGEMENTLEDDYSLPEAQDVPVVEKVIQTQQHEEALPIEHTDVVADTEIKHPIEVETEKKPEEEVDKRPKVDHRATYTGNKHDSKFKTQGKKEEKDTGNNGIMDGTEADTYEGTVGDSEFQPDWDLDGRCLRIELPIPIYANNQSGLVVIKIVVNNLGDVISAIYQAKDSTLSTSSALVAEAQKAAMKAKFSDSKLDLQSGTITYTFTLNKNHEAF